MSTAREISTLYGLSFNLMARILLLLKKANILTSIQGTKGGYELNAELDNLSLLDLMQIISGQPLLLTNCLSNNEVKKKKCQVKPERCNIFGSIKSIQVKVDNLINEITLKEIIKV